MMTTEEWSRPCARCYGLLVRVSTRVVPEAGRARPDGRALERGAVRNWCGSRPSALLPRPSVGRPERRGAARAFIAKAVSQNDDAGPDRAARLTGAGVRRSGAGFRARRRFRGPFPSLPRAVVASRRMRRCADDGWPSTKSRGCHPKRGRAAPCRAAAEAAALACKGEARRRSQAGSRQTDPQMWRTCRGRRCRTERAPGHHLLIGTLRTMTADGGIPIRHRRLADA